MECKEMRRWNEIMKRHEVLKWKRETNEIMMKLWNEMKWPKWNEMEWPFDFTTPFVTFHFRPGYRVSSRKLCLQTCLCGLSALKLNKAFGQVDALPSRLRRHGDSKHSWTLRSGISFFNLLGANRESHHEPGCEPPTGHWRCRATRMPSNWREEMPYTGSNFGDGGSPLLEVCGWHVTFCHVCQRSCAYGWCVGDIFTGSCTKSNR